MKKILVILLVLFVLFDIVLAVIFFGPKNVTSPLLSLLPKNCKVVDSKYCKTITIVGNEKLNETVVALFSLSKGTKVYSPVDGQLDFLLTPSPDNLPYHTVKGVDGSTYFLVFEPQSIPKSRSVKAGEVIGVTTGKRYATMKNYTLAVSVAKGQIFGKFEFDTLFR